MFKRHGKIILIITIAVQLTFPLWFLGYQANTNKHLNDDANYVKLNLNEVSFVNYDNEAFISLNFSLYEVYENENYYLSDYLVFEPPVNNDYSAFYLSDEPETTRYVKIDNIFDIEYCDYDYENELLKDEHYLTLYSKESELINVIFGDTPDTELTEAYALLKVYKNHFEVKEVYIGGYSLDEYVQLYLEGKINLSRYNLNLSDTSKFTEEDFVKIIGEENKHLYKEILDDLGFYADLSGDIYTDLYSTLFEDEVAITNAQGEPVTNVQSN